MKKSCFAGEGRGKGCRGGRCHRFILLTLSPDKWEFPRKKNHHCSVPRSFFRWSFLLSGSFLSQSLPSPSLLHCICKFLPFGTVFGAMEKWCLRGERQSAAGLESVDGESPWQPFISWLPAVLGVRLLSSRPGNLGPLMVSGFRWKQNNSLYTVLCPVPTELEDMIQHVRGKVPASRKSHHLNSNLS